LSCAYATITNAVTSASDGDTINVASGTYLEEVNLSKPGLQLMGAGYATTTITGRKDAGGSTTLTLGANNLLVDGFTITRDGNNPTDWGTNVKTQGVTFNQGTTGSTLQNSRVTGNRNGVYLNNTQGQAVRNNIISDNRTGMQLANNVTGLVVSENEITDNWTMGILFNFNTGFNTSSVQIQNNNISGNWYGEVQNRWDADNGIMDLSGNWFGSRVITTSTVNSTEPGYDIQIPAEFGGTAAPPADPVAMIGGVQSANVDYSPWLNAGTDTDGVKIGFQGAFSSLNVSVDSPQSGIANHIQEGIDTATTGGAVSVWDGTYYGGFTINKSLTLHSEHGAAATIVHGGLNLPAIYVASIRASDVTLDGFTVTNPNYSNPGADVSGIMAAYYGDPLIQNVHILNNIVTVIGSPDRVLSDPETDWNATGIVSSGQVDGLEIAHNTVFNIHHINTGAGNDISPVGIGAFGE
jgi:parallel beta-helix repeat protein